MLSVNDILSKKFEKSAVGGYRVDEVNQFLNDIYDYVNTLLDEKEVLEEKLSVLADKVEEYRSDEDSLRAALIGAQKLGDSVVKDAKVKAEAIMEEATSRAETLLSEARHNIEKETVALAKIQREVASFKNKLLVLYKAHIELIDKMPEDETSLERQVLQENVHKASPQPEEDKRGARPEADTEPLHYIPPEEEESAYMPQPIDLEDLQEDSADQEQARNYSSKFGMLQFGEGFDLHRDE